MKRLLPVLVVSLLAGFPQQHLWTQPKGPESTNSILDEFREQQAESGEVVVSGAQDSAQTAYEVFVYSHRRAVFQWQLLSSQVVFWLVVAIVFVGLLFAGMQFYVSLRRSAKPPEGESSTGSASEVTELEASLQGIKVRSSVLGVIILVISLGFLYLYLVHVYPIKVVQEIPTVQSESE